MKNLKLFFFISCAIVLAAKGKVYSQGISINTSGANPDTSAMLDVSSTTKGFLLPRMTTIERNAISLPAEGLQIFNTTSKCFQVYLNSQWQNVFCDLICSSPPTMPSAITGNAAVCQNATTEGYYINQVAGATYYIWSVPSGASIVSGQGTTGIFVDYGSASGDVSVKASNNCGISSAQTIAVSVTNPPDAAGSISGTGTVCRSQSGVAYSVGAISGATNYVWTYSGTGFSIASGSGTNSITADFSGAATSGILTVYGENGCGSGTVSADYPVTVIIAPSSPVEATHTPSTTEITWKWHQVVGATGYKWNTVNDYNTAIDLSTDTIKTENGLTCETAYTRYVWAYNSCDNSLVTTLTETSGACCGGIGTGGTITTVGSYTIHTFTSSGTFKPPLCVTSVDVLLIGGGGGGAQRHGGGGGAGGFLEVFGHGVTPLTDYSVYVGPGGKGWATGVVGGIVCGTPYPAATSGDSSTFAGLVAKGGGGSDGVAGGSGAGGGACNQPGGAGFPGQGNNGGASMAGGCGLPCNHVGGGGGGAGSAGSDGVSNTGGNGGAGKSSSMSGAPVTYAGGGGGGTCSTGVNGKGGSGGGGDAGYGSTPGQNGVANSGGGGGAGTWNGCTDYRGGDGGSGIVIIRYITP